MKKLSRSERLHKGHRPPASAIVGVTWYVEAEWRRVKAGSTDPELFESTFQEWSAMAEGGLRTIKKSGVSAVKVLVIANELLSWCLLKNKENNAAARAEFVSEKVRAQHQVGT